MVRNGWQATPARARAIAFAVAGCCLAVIFRRADLAVIVSGFAMAAAVDWREPRQRPSSVTTVVDPEVAREGEEVSVTHRVRPPADHVLLTLVGRDGQARIGWSPQEPTPAPPPPCWGHHLVTPRAGHWSSLWGGWTAALAISPPATLTRLPDRATIRLRHLPPPEAFDHGPEPGHRPGDGSDYTGLRLLEEGEAPRRVNWAATQRLQRIVVTQTLRDVSGSYLLVVDGDDVCTEHHEVVRQTAGIAAQLSRTGATLALGVLGCGDQIPVPFGSGRRHLARIEVALAHATPSSGRAADDFQPARIQQLSTPRGTVVIVLSPLRTASVKTVLPRLARAGHRPIVLDTSRGPRDALGVLEERVRHLSQETRGIPVLPWTSTETALDLARVRPPRDRR